MDLPDDFAQFLAQRMQVDAEQCSAFRRANYFLSDRPKYELAKPSTSFGLRVGRIPGLSSGPPVVLVREHAELFEHSRGNHAQLFGTLHDIAPDWAISSGRRPGKWNSGNKHSPSNT